MALYYFQLFRSKQYRNINQMIQVQIQEWQQIKAKISRLEQQLLDVKNQNHQLKLQNIQLRNLLNSNSNSQKESFSSKGNIQTSKNHQSPKPQHLIDKSSQSDIVIPQSQTKQQNHKISHTLQLQPQLNEIVSNKLHQNPYTHMNQPIKMHLSNLNNTNQQTQLPQNNFKNQPYPNSITVSRKPNNVTPWKNIPSSQQKSDFHSDESHSSLHLIEQICVFGPNLAPQHLHQVTFKKDQNQFLPPTLFYPQNDSKYEHYSNYLFPKKCRVKPTQKSHIIIEANKILFKNSKKTQPNIFVFQGNQNLQHIQKTHPILQISNPSKRLYALTIEFNDFAFQHVQRKETIIKKANSEDEQLEEMYEMESPSVSRQNRTSLLEINVKGFLQEQIRMESVSLKDIELQSERVRMYRSTFCLCIFTYFPFIAYLQSIISAIFDEVKLKRIENFPQTGEFKDCDVYYFIKEIDLIAKNIMTYVDSHPVRLGSEMVLSINEIKLQIEMSRDQIIKHLFSDWASKVIKLMQRQVFYEIYCMVMLEESVMFVCQDQKLLSFIVLLFGSMLTIPFSYPYPVVSVLFSEQLLQTPFTSIVGIHQSEQWLRQAIQQRLIDVDNKQIVMVSEKQVKIRRREGFLVPKSQCLRKIFTRFHKPTENSSLSSMLLSKSSILRKTSLPLLPISSQNEGNEQVYGFFDKLQKYYQDNIFAYLPKDVRIENKDDGELNKVTIRNSFLNVLQRQYKEANRDYVKDEFIREFIKSEIFGIYLAEQYSLDS